MKCIQYLALIVVLYGSTPAFPQSLRDQYKAPFEGPILKNAFKKGTIFLCVSNVAGSTGIYPEAGGHQVISEFTKQSKPATWYLIIEKENAISRDNQGHQHAMATTQFNSEGIILVGAGRHESVQVITIDPNNASFVYTTQNTGLLWNRASTFVGKCTTTQKQ